MFLLIMYDEDIIFIRKVVAGWLHDVMLLLIMYAEDIIFIRKVEAGWCSNISGYLPLLSCKPLNTTPETCQINLDLDFLIVVQLYQRNKKKTACNLIILKIALPPPPLMQAT